MVTVGIRKQGGAAIITIPSAILKLLGLGIGSKLQLDVKGKLLIACAAPEIKQKRYSLRELLTGTTKENIQELHNETVWAREGYAAGSELE